jgi:hypothetical protein
MTKIPIYTAGIKSRPATTGCDKISCDKISLTR